MTDFTEAFNDHLQKKITGQDGMGKKMRDFYKNSLWGQKIKESMKKNGSWDEELFGHLPENVIPLKGAHTPDIILTGGGKKDWSGTVRRCKAQVICNFLVEEKK